MLAQLSFTAAGAFVDGEFPAGPDGRDGDRRAGLVVAAAERGLAAGGAAIGLPAGRGEDAAADRAGGRPVVVPRRDLGCGVRGFQGLRLRSPRWMSGWSGQWGDALAGDGLGQAHRFAGGLADVGVVQ